MIEKDKLIKLENCTRIEVIDDRGRSYVNWKASNEISISLQDDGRTLKVVVLTPSKEV